MSRTSIIIPAKNEIFLQKTVSDIFNKAAGDVEVIVVLDDYWPVPPLNEHPKLIIAHHTPKRGMRPSLNEGFTIASGKYIMKCDAHIMFDEGFDEKLKADCDDNWLVVPRRYSLDPEDWKIEITGKSPIDYEYLSYPFLHMEEIGMHGRPWNDRARDRKDILIDDNMSFQGSCWFMPKDYFWKLGPLQVEGYGDFVQDPQELSLKVMLSGGKFMVNKKTWYAHLHKGKTYGRGYYISKPKMYAGCVYSANYWMRNSWKDRIHDMEWLIDKFWPVPTWPENWRAECQRILSAVEA